MTKLASTATPQPAADLATRMKIEIREIGIPPRPTILNQIEQEIAKEEPDFIRLAKMLSQDVGLSASLIKVANSPYFSFGKKVPTVQEALLVLGLKLILRTVAGLALQQVFKHVPNMERFWDTSAAIAEVSSWLARRVGRQLGIRPEDAYTFALFRDCGIPVLMIPFAEYRPALAAANAEAEDAFTAVEDAAIGINHAVVGAELAETWLLPEETWLAIRHHHDRQVFAPDSSLVPPRARALIAIAQFAEYLEQQHSGRHQTREWDKLGADCLACLGLDADTLAKLSRDFQSDNPTG